MINQISISDSLQLAAYAVGGIVGTLCLGYGLDLAGLAELGIAERLSFLLSL